MTAEIDLLAITGEENRREEIDISLHILIKNWRCVAGFSGDFTGHLSISFEGVFWCRLENIESIIVSGDIHVVGINPLAADRNGYLRLLGMPDHPFLNIQLKCNMEANERLFMILSAAFANVGYVGMDLYLRKPDDAQDDFWKIGWQEQRVAINGFSVYLEWQSKYFNEEQ